LHIQYNSPLIISELLQYFQPYSFSPGNHEIEKLRFDLSTNQV
jgi:hypothetical protein